MLDGISEEGEHHEAVLANVGAKDWKSKIGEMQVFDWRVHYFNWKYILFVQVG